MFVLTALQSWGLLVALGLLAFNISLLVSGTIVKEEEGSND